MMTSQSPTKPNKANGTAKNPSKDYNILVYIRLRPVLPSEYGKEVAITCKDEKTIIINTQSNMLVSKFDYAFSDTSTQIQVFSGLQHYVDAVFQGFNCTVFAYGQTGSGKTHTMFGSDWEHLIYESQVNRTRMQTTYIDNIASDSDYSGLIPRSIYELFCELEKPEHKERKFVIYCSFLQLYNEKVYDLLQDKYGLKPLQLRENKIDGIYVDGLTEFCVSSYQDCLMLMQRGERNRFIRSTSSNVKSSRSHTIFQLVVESAKADGKGKLHKAKLNLCDLAGSEKIKKHEDIKGAHLSELKNINLSLTTLGKVIHNLSSNQKMPIPYRESKLTRLLQDSLGGNTRTCLIATLAPTLECVDESISTLKFAERARHIVTKVKQNSIDAVDAELVKKLQNEIKYLREILNIRRKGTSTVNEVHNKLLMLQEENDRLRQNHVSIDHVEKLMMENRQMKMELQKLRSGSAGDTNFDGLDENNTDTVVDTKSNANTVSNAQQTKSQDISSFDDTTPKLKSNQNMKSFDFEGQNFGEEKKRGLSVYQSQESNSNLLNGPRSIKTNHSTSSSNLMNAGKFLVQSPMGNSNNYSTDFEMPVRVRGKNPFEGKMNGGQSMTELSKMEERKKEQKRALQRLKELEKLTERKSTFSGTNKSRGNISSDKISQYSGSQSTASTNNVKFQPNYKDLYDPYKVRQEIEDKYSSNKPGSKKSSLIDLNKKKNDEYKRNRLQALQKQLL